MPLSALQKQVLQLLARHRSPDSFVAGATLLHAGETSPRYSRDIDINHDVRESVAQCAQLDGSVLKQHGFEVIWRMEEPLFYRADVTREGTTVKLEWVFDSAFRFFPVEADEQFGYRLSFWDVATNKVLALVGRVEPRDFLDILFLDEHHLSLGALAWAASGKDPGLNPFLILTEARRTARYRPEDFSSIVTAKPVDLIALGQQWRAVLARADALLPKLPPQDVGCLYLDAQNRVVEPDPDSPDFGRLRRHFGSVKGAWPVVR
jgi:hypothetical protein